VAAVIVATSDRLIETGLFRPTHTLSLTCSHNLSASIFDFILIFSAAKIVCRNYKPLHIKLDSNFKYLHIDVKDGTPANPF
jgi:hypothetical protein